MNKLLVVGIAGVLASTMAFAAPAPAHSAQDEVTTAHAHAVMASTADTVEIGHAHMHHVINCLVGPQGKGFDAAAGNPCKGLGNGAIPDSKGDAALQAKLKAALADVQAGLAAYDLAGIHANGKKAAAALKTKDATAPAASW
ncbi:MAG TPA: hypothetical protein VFJ87_08230 [Rhodanobacteraceae bacterium]|jgi:hypothetical protein|nr:hypothetical protein [Rhodanobacteraceae bacterium]